jgi:hypothetical protein
MEKTLQVLNRMEREGVVERYAIGGGIAAMFYIEPILTYDLDVFVFLPATQGKLLSLSPIYDFLRKAGFAPEGEHVVIRGTRVQFIPAYNVLVEEALRQAREIRYGRTKTRVLLAEHLLAIMIQTGRPKDRARISQMTSQAKLDRAALRRILARHGLDARWAALQEDQ